MLNPDTQTSAATPITITAPVLATLTSLSPATAVMGGPAFTLTVNGTGFTSAATVAWAGSPRPTTFLGATQLSAAIPATDLATAATISVDVAQGGLRSANQLPFTVTPAVATLTSLSPSSTTAGGPAFTLTLTGANFTPAASVTFNGAAKTTTFLSATQLSAAITSADIATAGTATVDVIQSGVHAAGTLPFTITAAAPIITSLSPAAILAGSPDTTISVAGTGFTTTSSVQSNGAALTTTYTSATLLQAVLPAASLATPATLSITVVNPANTGGTSNAIAFTVTAPVSGKIVQLASPDYLTGGPSNKQFSLPPTLSQDGRYVAYASQSSDLVAADTNNQFDAFLRDTCLASAPVGCVPSTTRMSLDPDTQYSNGASRLVVLSADARYALFDAANSGSADFRDNCTGATACLPANSHVSIVPGSATPVPPAACCSVLSPDGRYILFSALYTNPAGTQTRGIYVRDLCAAVTGCTPATRQVVLGPGTTPPRQPFQSDISTGGRYVLFRTAGNDINPSLTSTLHLFLEDTCLGAPTPCTVTDTIIDSKFDGTESEGNLANDAQANEQPSLSEDGRYVVFSSTDQSIVSPATTAHVSQVYVRDTCIGAPTGCVPTSTLVSADPTALAKNYRSFIGFRGISQHGRYVAYAQEGLDPTNPSIDSIRVRDTCLGAPTGCVPSISTASLDPNNITGATHVSFLYPSISADGHYVALTGADGQIYLALTGY